MKQLICAIALLCPVASTAQPYSESMADCASVYQNAAQWMKTDESADKLMNAAIQWAEAAVRQSQIERQGTDTNAIWTRIDAKTEEWEAKGAQVFFSQDFRDWMQYCRKIARHTNVSITP